MTSAAGKSSLRVLLVEDNPDDAALSQHLLKKSFPETCCEVVETQQEFSRQVRSTYYDVILADYALAGWTGVDAFHLMRKSGRVIPFILVTGALRDAKAIECVKSGITDYVLKDHPERLGSAIARALEEKKLLDEHTRAERALKDGNEKFQTLAESISAATFIEQGTLCTYVNQPAERITGYSHDELVKMNFWRMVVPESRNVVTERVNQYVDKISRYELRIRTKQRNTRWLDITIGMFQLEAGLASLITAFDISERKRQEKEILNLDSNHFSLVELPLLRCYR